MLSMGTHAWVGQRGGPAVALPVEHQRDSGGMPSYSARWRGRKRLRSLLYCLWHAPLGLPTTRRRTTVGTANEAQTPSAAAPVGISKSRDS